MALYLEHFGLAEPPFRITPHTDFFFDGADRGTTLEALVYAVLHDEGIVKVSGEVGSGKTMLSRVLMERLPAHVDTIYLATPSLAADEILHAIADDLELALPRERRALALRELQEQLIRRYAGGRRVVVLIDEAHVMPDDTLEQVRLLSNLESNRHKLLQIVLFGQPELDDMLAKASLRQLRDRITHAFRMRPLAGPDVGNYLSFRMRAAGYRGPEVFTRRAAALIARASGGLTRRINILADKSLLAAFTRNTHAVTPREVRAAIRDAEFTRAAPRTRPGVYVAGALVGGLALGFALQWLLEPPAPSPSATPKRAALQAAVRPVAAAPAVAPAPPGLSEEQRQRIEGYSHGGQRLLGERLEATLDTLRRAPDGHYTIELFVTENTSQARMERFLTRARDMVPLDKVFVIPIASGGRYRLQVAYGQFETADQARAAERALPPKYQRAFETFLRSFAELREPL